MTYVKRAARPLGGIVLEPPLSQKESEAVYGRPILDETWSAVCHAFKQFGYHLRALEATQAHRAKDPSKLGWEALQQTTVKAMEAALGRIEAARGHGDFLREASENYCLRTYGRSYLSEHNADQLLREAYRKIMDAVLIIERAQPDEVETPSGAEARKILARSIVEALRTQDGSVAVSDGHCLPDDAAESDLTPVEQLISALGIHEAERPSALSRWLRRALAGQIRG